MRALAKTASDSLMAAPGVLGICVFGSVARGKADANSDIDLLVLGKSDRMRPSELYSYLPDNLRQGSVSISYFTPRSLDEYLRNWSRFAAHLRQEGRVLHDNGGKLREALNREIPVSTEGEAARQLRRLRGLGHADRFGMHFFFPLAQLYRIGRTLTYDRLATHDILEFDQKVAFETLAKTEPALADNLALIARLAPFFERARNRESSNDLPFDPVGKQAKAEFMQAHAAVEAVAALFESKK